MPTSSHLDDKEILKCIRSAQTPLEKVLLACRSKTPIPLLHELADAYLGAVNQRHTKEWEIFWTTTAHDITSTSREQVIRSLQAITPTPTELYELLEHAWWRGILLTKPVFEPIITCQEPDRSALILWLLNKHALFEAWCQTLLFLPPQFQPRERPLKIWHITSDRSLVSDGVFLRVAKILAPLLKKIPDFTEEVAVWRGDCYHRGWVFVLRFFEEDVKPCYRKNKREKGATTLHYIRIPRYGKIILDLDKLLHEEGWGKFQKIYRPPSYKAEKR